MEVVKLEKVDSTNNWAKSNIASLKDFTCVAADCQTNGRGRLNRSWIDLGCGNIFASIVLKPSETFNEIYPNLTQYLSVVLCEVFEDYGLVPQIKWPNDVLIDGKKIAGILSETVMEGNTLKGIVLGFGVNLKSEEGDLKNIPDKIATSLNLEIGKIITPEEFLNVLFEKFEKNYDEFLSKGFEFIKDDYVKRTDFLGKEISVKGFDKTQFGVAGEITARGELVLEKDSGEKVVLTIGDINYE